jgi:AcrR family transcriptional regulator
VISQSEDRRNEILNAALKLFVEYGFHGTPTSKIAQQAGVANGTLFHYFKTKDDLIVSLYTKLKTDLAAYNAMGQLPANADIKQINRHAYINALAWALKNPEGFKFIQQFTASPFLLLIAPEEVEKQSGPALKLIEAGIQSGVLKPAPVALLYAMITNHLYSVNEYLIKAGLPEAEENELVEQSFEMVWRMVT